MLDQGSEGREIRPEDKPGKLSSRFERAWLFTDFDSSEFPFVESILSGFIAVIFGWI